MMNNFHQQTPEETIGRAIPLSIKRIILDKKWKRCDIGMSGSHVFISKEYVFKISEISDESTNEINNYRSLHHVDCIPTLHGFACDEKYNYLIIKRIKGKMLGENANEDVFSILKQVYTTLTKVEISNSMCDQSLSQRLIYAENNVNSGLVDMATWDTVLHMHHFESPQSLLAYLKNNTPAPTQLCFSHGDLCFENILVNKGKFSHLIDLGRTGLADPYQDLALMFRSACYHFERDVTTELEHVLGIKVDRIRLNYYMLLDELF